jgi:hypothetical protein
VHRARTRVRLSRSRYVFFRKHYGRLHGDIYRILFVVAMLIRMGFLSVQFVCSREVRPTWKEEMQAYCRNIWLQDWATANGQATTVRRGYFEAIR